MGDDYITAGEWGRFRADHSQWRIEIARQINDGFTGVNARLDQMNGRARDTAAGLEVVEADLSRLTQHGCAQYEKHRETLETVVVPTLARVARPRVWDEWHPAAKVGASVGGFALLATLMELVGRVLAHFGI
jgi:hypothetical protein